MTCPAHALARSRGMLLQEDVDLVRELVRGLPRVKKVRIVDLGAGSGTTALSVFAERTKRVVVLSVDNNLDNLHWTQKAVENVGQKDNWRGLEADTWSIPRVLRRVNLLLYDASKSYEDVKRSLLGWIPLMKSGDFVWVHDYFYSPPNSYPGVKEAVDWMEKAKKVRMTRMHGLSWAGVVL